MWLRCDVFLPKNKSLAIGMTQKGTFIPFYYDYMKQQFFNQNHELINAHLIVCWAPIPPEYFKTERGGMSDRVNHYILSRLKLCI